MCAGSGREEMNNRRKLLIALGAGALIAPFGVFAQQQSKIWRIGVLETTSMTINAANLNAFLKGMRELGYVEGRNFIIDYRSADGRAERFPDLAAELVRGTVDLIVTRGTPASGAATKTTRTIPVVTVAIAEPLLFAASLARPGGNITGLSSIQPELSAKRLELLREMVPGVARIAVLMNMGNAALPPQWKEVETAARSIGVQVQLFDVRRAEDLDRAFEGAVKQRAKALVVGQDGLIQANGKHIVELAARNRLPAIYASSEFMDLGGLVSYGVNYPDLYRRAASYVDKIMKGAKPGDIPIEQPTRFELIINRKTAKALGLAIPQSLLVSADKVIE
jgi:putative ABC transport system substrate-binding protein